MMGKTSKKEEKMETQTNYMMALLMIEMMVVVML